MTAHWSETNGNSAEDLEGQVYGGIYELSLDELEALPVISQARPTICSLSPILSVYGSRVAAWRTASPGTTKSRWNGSSPAAGSRSSGTKRGNPLRVGLLPQPYPQRVNATERRGKNERGR
jgi:hypothetical protein